MSHEKCVNLAFWDHLASKNVNNFAEADVDEDATCLG